MAYIAAAILMGLMGIRLIIIGIKALIGVIQGHKVTAVIAEVEARYRVDRWRYTTCIDYYYKGKAYEKIRLGFFVPGFYEDREIIVYVNPKSPSEPVHMGEVILIFFGLLIIKLGISLYQGM